MRAGHHHKEPTMIDTTHITSNLKATPDWRDHPTIAAPETLFDRQVELVGAVIALREGMADHLRVRVLPHLEPAAQETVRDTIAFLDDYDDVGINLLCMIDIARAEVRNAIAAETSTRKVTIPRDHLIGLPHAHATCEVVSADAKALTAALPPIDALVQAAERLVQFAKAVLLSADIVSLD